MKKYILFSLIFILIGNYSMAQQYNWAFQLGADHEDRTYAVTTDINSDVYVTGTFSDSIDLDPSSAVHKIYGGALDFYLAKYDSAGNYSWGFGFGSANATIEHGLSLATDKQGNIYVCGGIGGNVDADPSAGITTLTAGSISTGFVAKYNSLGNIQWAFSIPSSANTLFKTIKLDGQDNVYITGYLEGTADLDPGANLTSLTANEYRDVLLAKYTSNGNFLWAFNLGGGGGLDIGRDITFDSQNNVYLCGDITNLTDVDPSNGIAQINTSNTQVPYLGKYKSDGTYVWGIAITPGSSNSFMSSIAADTLGNIYATGNFYGTSDFDPSSNTAILTSTYAAAFVAKYDTSGNYIWAHSIEGGPSGVIAERLAYNKKYGFVYVIGMMSGTIDFDPSANTYLLNTHGYGDAFVAQYSSFGSINWAFNIGVDSLFSEMTRAINVLDDGDFYIAGQFGSGTADFDPYPSIHNITSNADIDGFVAKYYLDPTGMIPVTAINNYNLSKETINIFPNPINDNATIAIPKKIKAECVATIYNTLGEEIISYSISGENEQLDFSKLENGIYFLIVKTDTNTITNKIVVQH